MWQGAFVAGSTLHARRRLVALALLTLLGPEGFAGYDNLIASVPDFTALDALPALRFA